MKIYGGETVEGYYSHIPSHIKSEVERQNDEYLLGISEDEYVEYLYRQYSLEPIEKDASRKLSVERLKEWREVDDIIGSVRHEMIRLKIGYPIVVNSKTSEVFEFDWGLFPARVDRWELDTNTGYIYATVDNSQDAIRNEVRLLDETISNKKALIETHNPTLKERIKGIVRGRKQKIEQDGATFKSLIQKIDIPLEVVDRNSVKPIDFGIRSNIQTLVPPKPKEQKEYTLDSDKVLTVIEIINNVATNFEAAPDTYHKLEEEELRNIILSSLNSVFAGKATGETFSKRGKTDIYLNIDRGNILIAECKWWKGEDTINEGISQLFRYLTWRQNFGIVVLFSKNKGFTQVLDSVKNAIQTHQSYKNRFREISSSHFESIHTFPEDEKKTVEIHTLVYNVYSEAKN